MSLYTDKKFVSFLSPKLDRFSQKSEFLWNCRCPYCGDSQKNKLKSRGYIYRKKSNLFYMCHNCGASTTLSNLLKLIDNSLYQEYVMERFKGESTGNVAKPDFNALKTNIQLAEKFNSNKINLDSIEKLNDNHIAKVYLKKRQIPEQYYSKIYFAENFKTFVDGLFLDHNKILYEEPRIVFPFYDEKNILQGIQGRAIGASKIRYITIKAHESAKKVYGLDTVDFSKRIYVVEGPIDSLFLDNAIALMDASLYKASPLIGKADFVFIYDNENRNKQIVQNMEKTIALGHKICIWPKNIVEKDINDMILAGYTKSELQSIIDSNTFGNLRAKMEFELWHKM